MRTTILISMLALGIGSATAKAEQFPFREAGPYRTIFVETATKACIRDALRQLNTGETRLKEIDFQLCDCKVAFVATFVTSKDVEEATKGGAHVTPRYQALADTAETGCLKTLTGK